jgi:hypothetical protein
MKPNIFHVGDRVKIQGNDHTIWIVFESYYSPYFRSNRVKISAEGNQENVQDISECYLNLIEVKELQNG